METLRRYTVSDGLVAGAYPDTQASVEALEGAGVTLFVDLTHPSDPLDAYDRHLVGARRVGEPIPDMGTPTEGQLIRILDTVDDARAGGGTAYVHCWGGVGRTGTVVGCWLVRHGLDRGDAIATIAALRAGLPGARPSPETAAQVALIRSWRPGR
jgi:Cyclin-dependent kinase inhibitor 3 (CDKN3)